MFFNIFNYVYQTLGLWCQPGRPVNAARAAGLEQFHPAAEDDAHGDYKLGDEVYTGASQPAHPEPAGVPREVRVGAGVEERGQLSEPTLIALPRYASRINQTTTRHLADVIDSILLHHQAVRQDESGHFLGWKRSGMWGFRMSSLCIHCGMGRLACSCEVFIVWEFMLGWSNCH